MTGLLSYTLEHLLGIPSGLLRQPGDWSLRFHPAWPWQTTLGASSWNVALSAFALLLVWYAYRPNRRPRAWRITGAALRFLLLLWVLFFLNRPELTIMRSRVEQSVLAVLIDDSSSMSVPDVGPATDVRPRLTAAQDLFTAHNAELLRALAKKHSLRIYRFDSDAEPLAQVSLTSNASNGNASIAPAVKAIGTLNPSGSSTQVVRSILSIAGDLQGQQVAGVVLLSDGRDTPSTDTSAEMRRLRESGLKIYPVLVGSDSRPKNIQVQAIDVDDVAFVGDAVSVRTRLLATGYAEHHPIHIVLKDRKTGQPLEDEDGKIAETTITADPDKPVDAELRWKPSRVGSTDVGVQADVEPGEIDAADNVRSKTVSVVDAKVSVLFVDGYPRWDYRYLKNSLLRDKSIALSCLLATADYKFLQEGNLALPGESDGIAGHFPNTIDEMTRYDVIIFGDVNPRYFTDNQLQLVNDFVSRGGGFLMVAGERWSPQAYRNTPIEPLLPVSLARIAITDPNVPITEGFRPAITHAGDATGIFRFLKDPVANATFIHDQIPQLFWYCRGLTAKSNVGEVLAENPLEAGPDGHPAPLLVAGRFGGRTLFSAVDDSWRWRFYNDQSVFDSYWVRQIRYLARNRKLNQRRLSLSSDQPTYETGDRVHLTLNVIDPSLNRQMPDRIDAQLLDSTGQPVRKITLARHFGSADDSYTGLFTADTAGSFTVRLPTVVPGVDSISSQIEVILPKLELNDPSVDRVQMARLASESFGKTIPFETAAADIEAIPSAEKVLPQMSGQPLWQAPISLAVFAVLVTAEWITRKIIRMA